MPECHMPVKVQLNTSPYSAKLAPGRVFEASLILALLCLTAGFRRIVLNMEDLEILRSVMRDGEISESRGSPFMKGMLALHQMNYGAAVGWFQGADPCRSSVRFYLATAQGKISDSPIDVKCGDLRKVGERTLCAAILAEELRSLSKDKQEVLRQCTQEKYPDSMVSFAGYFLGKQLFSSAATWARLSPQYPESHEAKIIAGSGYFYEGKVEEAEKSFRGAYMQAPDSLSAYWYGRTLDVSGKSALAIPLLEEAVRKAPNGFASWCLRELGIAYGHVGRYADAISVFDRALLLDKSRPNTDRIAAARAALPLPSQPGR